MRIILFIIALSVLNITGFAQERQEMNMKEKTVRLILPQWQGGVNPDYAFGAELLAFIAPPSEYDETIRIPVSMDFNDTEVSGGIACEKALLAQYDSTIQSLEQSKAKRVIVFGGDCSVSQAPFDYLSGLYGKGFGILWLDAHPDISTIEDSKHDHEMVLANLIGHGESSMQKKTAHPVDKNRVMYAGLIEKDLRWIDRAAKELNITIATPNDLSSNANMIKDWIKREGITHLAIHWDLDVLDPQMFRANTAGAPGMTRAQYGCAVGEMQMASVINMINCLSDTAALVGLTIAEHMPWDAMNLRKAMQQLEIFK